MARALLLALSPFVVFAQTQPASDEVRVSSRPYVGPSSYTLRVETKIVDVGVTVRDAHGRTVSGLKRDDFRIYDDGKERRIAAFSEDRAAADEAEASGAKPAPPSSSAAAPEDRAGASAKNSHRPRFLAFVFDDLNVNNPSAAGDLKRAQSAAARFVKDRLPAGASVGVFTASGEDALDFTADRGRLMETIDGLKPHPRFTDQLCPPMTSYQAYRIAVRRDRETIRVVATESGQKGCLIGGNEVIARAESVWKQNEAISMATLAAVDRAVVRLAGVEGERVLVLTSEGFAGQTLEQQQDVIMAHAVRAGVVINSLVSQGVFSELVPGERFDDAREEHVVFTSRPGYQNWVKAEMAETDQRPQVMDETMAKLAHGTGGVIFERNNDLNLGFRQVTVPPAVTYRMSFTPQLAAPDGSYHELKVKLAHAGPYQVEARPGYFAQEAAPADNLREKVEREATASDALDGVAAGVVLQVTKRSESERVVQLTIKVDAGKLAFVKQGDRQTQRLMLVAAFFDEQGRIVTAREGEMDLALKPETYERVAKTGVNAELSFLVAPGTYNMRAVVGEAVNGAVAASTYSIQVK